MKLAETEIAITAENIESAKDQMQSACDQAAEIVPGCTTWGILYGAGNERGQMTIWPNSRGAIAFGGDSDWGDWDQQSQTLTLDTLDDECQPIIYDSDGDRVSE